MRDKAAAVGSSLCCSERLIRLSSSARAFILVDPALDPGWSPRRPRGSELTDSQFDQPIVIVPAKEQSIGLDEVLDRVTVQLFVRDDCTMIAAPVQCDVDRIPKGSHHINPQLPQHRFAVAVRGSLS